MRLHQLMGATCWTSIPAFQPIGLSTRSLVCPRLLSKEHSMAHVLPLSLLTCDGIMVLVTGAVLGRQNTTSEQPPAQYGRH